MEDVSPDTYATLILCGRFGRPRDSGIEPLEPREYNRLVAWLLQRSMRPSDLPGLAETDLQEPDLPIEPARLLRLLDRGGALALAVETWTNRGLWVLGRSDEPYPTRLKNLGPHAPPLLYGVGDQRILSGDGPALAVVGSRDVDEPAEAFTQDVARACARQGIRVVSGGARGIDSLAMGSAVEAGGTALGVLADSLLRAAVAGKNAPALVEGELLLVSPYDPASGFNVGNAMGRNKYIYALADAALVVSTSAGTGGTWNGAIEALKRGAPPVFVRLQEGAPEGNFKLLEEGAHAFPDEPWSELADWLAPLGEPAPDGDQSLTQAQLW